MPIFLDTSALAKLYVEEPGSENMTTIVGRPGVEGGFFISDCVALELYGLFAKKLRIAESARRTSRLGRSLEKANRARYQTASREFKMDYEGNRFSLVDVGSEVIRHAAALAQRYPERQVNAMDLIHVATVFHLTSSLHDVGAAHDVTLVSCDRPLLNLARAQGVDCWNPETDPTSTIRDLRLLP